MGGGGETDSEQRYATVIAAMAEGVVLQDTSLAILACNDAAERILGLTRDQMMGRTSLDPRWRAIHEDGSPFPGHTHPVPVTLATGRPQRDVIMGVHKPDGALSWISINSLPLFRPGEALPYAAVCTFSDITGRVEAERALAASEQRYRRIVETSMDGIWIVDLDSGASVFCNQRMADILGASVAAVLARPLEAWCHPDDAAALRRRLSERSPSCDVRLRRDDGRDVPCGVAACPLEDSEARRLGLAMVRDLTAERRAEEELARNQIRIQQALEIARLGWFEDDFTVGRALVSPEVREICGWPPDVELSHEAWDALIHPDDAEAQRELFARAAQSGGAMASEFRIVRTDGTIRWVHATARLEPEPLSGRPRLMGVMMDVTARKLLEERLLEARKLEGIGRLAGGVAHDLNNLLTAIFASLTLLKQDVAADKDDDLAIIHTAADRAARLTRQLLAFARQQVIQLRALDLNNVVGELVAVLRRLIGEQIELDCRLGPDLWPVRGDVTQIEQVLLNLVANARDAMPDGGTLRVETRNVTLGEAGSEGAAGDHVVLSVADSGAGIDEPTLRHIFEPFFTTKRAGTGLGLASAYGTVRQLGGHIRVASQPGRGATFEVYLPRSSEAGPAAAVPARHRPAGAIHETLLLVEDDDLLRDVVSRGLGDLGYTVLTCRDGEHALATAAEHPGEIHLVITDVIMPRLSGRELAERIRRVRPGARILFVSGYSDNIIARQGILEPGIELLAKPFTIDTLAARIRELLDRVG